MRNAYAAPMVLRLELFFVVFALPFDFDFELVFLVEVFLVAIGDPR